MSTSEHAWDFQQDVPHFHPRPGMVSVHTELPHPLVTALEGLIAKLRWHLDALREWCKRLGMVMGMKEHRVDPDYNPEDDVRTLRQAIDQLRLAGGQKYFNGDNRDSGSDKRTLNWILSVLAMLVVSGVVGGIALYGRLASLESTVNSGMGSHEQRIRRLEDSNERRYRGD